MLTNLIGEKWLDDFFGYPMARNMHPAAANHLPRLMRTDVRETSDAYELEIELPGFKKDELQVSLENGYMKVSASHVFERKEENAEQESARPKYLRRERYRGSYSRTFYVGNEVQESDISARFEDGILTLSVLKKAEPETRKLIDIA